MREENGSGNPDTRKAAERYIRAGLSVIPISVGAKSPGRGGWQQERWTVEDVEELWNDGQGIGILWGEPSGGLVDIDCDWPEACIAAGIILPREPRRTFGRPGSPESHHVVRVEGELPKTRRYKIGGQGDERSVVELMSTGTQSLAPPSLHESGERRRWYEEQSAPKMPGPEVQEAAADIVTAALLARNWPGKGSRHDYVLSASGFIGRRLPRERTQRIMEAAIGASGDEEARGRLADVRSTLDSLEAGRPTTGGPSLDDLAPGVVEQLQRWHRWDQGFRAGEAHEHSEAGGQSLPSIVVNDRPLRNVGDEALAALQVHNKPPKLFARGGKIIRLASDENDAPIIQEADESVVRYHLTRAANFVKEYQRKNGVERIEVSPPRDAVQDVMSVADLPFPPLIGVPRTPFFRPDGTIVALRGYDPATRLYHEPSFAAGDNSRIEVAEEPADEDLQGAVEIVDEAVSDFPYVDKASAANTLALLLTPIMRNVTPGPVPLSVIDKPTPGTGGSLLAEVVALLATGSPAGMMSAPRDDEEVRKQLTSALMRGNLIVTIDNVDSVLSAPSLSRALSSDHWEDRVLGRSEMIRVPQRATWIASGNNIQLGGDMPRRAYWIRLDAGVERPWQREGFKHPELKPWIAANRSKLLSALLTMGRAWFARGAPQGRITLGGFEGWAHTIGGVLDVAGISGFLANLDEMYERAADGTHDWSAFLEAWREAYGDEARTTKQLAADLHNSSEEYAALREALPDEFGIADPERPDKALSRRLGNRFKKREGKPHGERRLCLKRAGSHMNAKLWQVVKAPTGAGENVSLVSLVSLSHPNVHARARAKSEWGPNQTKQTHRLISETDASCSEVGTSGSEASTSRDDFERTSCESLSAEQVGEELRRPNSGPSINLPLYLVGATTLEILTKSVLVAKDLKADAWEEHAGVVEEGGSRSEKPRGRVRVWGVSTVSLARRVASLEDGAQDPVPSADTIRQRGPVGLSTGPTSTPTSPNCRPRSPAPCAASSAISPSIGRTWTHPALEQAGEGDSYEPLRRDNSGRSALQGRSYPR